MGDKKEVLQNKETEPLCNHKGKWTGGGQSIFNTGTALIIISTSVCGECGRSVINVNKLGVTVKKPSDIVSTDGKLHLPSRFGKKN